MYKQKLEQEFTEGTCAGTRACVQQFQLQLVLYIHPAFCGFQLSVSMGTTSPASNAGHYKSTARRFSMRSHPSPLANNYSDEARPKNGPGKQIWEPNMRAMLAAGHVTVLFFADKFGSVVGPQLTMLRDKLRPTVSALHCALTRDT